MTESGSSSFTPGSRPTAPTAERAQTPNAGEQLARVLSASGGLRDVRQPVTLIGEVVRARGDGTVTIRTDDGTVDVQPRGGKSDTPAFKPGDRVEISIPAGHPPRQVTLRDAPAQQQPATQQPQSPAPPRDATAQNDRGETPARSPIMTRPALPPQVQEQAAQATPRPIQQTTPPPVATQQPSAPPAAPIIRLTPLPPAQIQDLVFPAPLPDLPDAMALPPAFARTAFVAPALAQAILDALPAAIIKIKAGAIPPSQTHIPVMPQNFVPPAPGPGQPADANPAVNVVIPPMNNPAAPLPPFAMAAPDVSVPQNVLAGLVTGIRNILGPAPANPAPIVDVGAPITTATVTPVEPRARPFDAAIRTIIPARHAVNIVAPDVAPQTIPAVIPNAKAIPHDGGAVSAPARVIAHTASNQPVIMMTGANNALFIVQTPMEMDAGTGLSLIPRGGPVPVFDPVLAPQPSIPAMPVAALAATPLPAGFAPAALMTGWQWDSLDDLFRALNTLSPQIAANVGAMIPATNSGPAHMGGAILFLMAAIRSGDVGILFGDRAIDILRRDVRGQQALSRVSRDFGALSKMDSEPVTQDWKSLALPMMGQNGIEKIHLYYRRQNNEDSQDENDKKGGSTRFIFDLNLNRIGDLQLDGLMKGKKLDLIVRAKTPFSTPMQARMKGVFVDTLENAGLKGALGFQFREADWVRVERRKTGLEASA